MGTGPARNTEVSYQVTRWSNTYSGARGGMSSQWNWDDRPRSKGCTWVYEIVGKLKCPKADTRERQVGVYSVEKLEIAVAPKFHPRWVQSKMPCNSPS